MAETHKSYVAFRFLDYLAILIFVVFIVAGAYFFWQHSVAKAQNTNLKAEIISVTKKIEVLKKKDYEKIALSQNFLKKINNDAIVWSNVIDKLRTLTPEGVEYNSYVGTEANEINISVEAGSVDKVIATIKAYTGDAGFEDVFVPSVNKGVTGEGEKLYSFTINAIYNK
ncbi:hypothetical protein KKG71_05490 [Patescibacteria group bacterium]|nr:hypothetical protein [Patescibacteria group bacterium]